jgi:hypothetical protein
MPLSDTERFGCSRSAWRGVKSGASIVKFGENTVIRWLFDDDFFSALKLLFKELEEDLGVKISIILPPNSEDQQRDVLPSYGYLLWGKKDNANE